MQKLINRRQFLRLAALFPMLLYAKPGSFTSINQTSTSGKFPNILFIVLDTLSARHMSVYGYPRDTTPNIARFAERATVYHSHYAGGNFTTPGTASLFTGTYPWSHRAFHMHGVVVEPYRRKNFFSLTAQETYGVTYSHNLLAESLLNQFKGDLGLYLKTRDLALVDTEYSDLVFPEDYNASFWSEALILRGTGSRPSSLFLSLLYQILSKNEISRISRQYTQRFPLGLSQINDVYYVLEDAVDWLISNLGSLPNPYMAYFHLLPPHEPYFPRREFINYFRDDYKPMAKPTHFSTSTDQVNAVNEQRRLYDAHIAYADSEFGRLIDTLQKEGTLNNTMVILTSDHGELFERGIRGHVTPTLYEPLINIPLIISRPGQTSREDIYDVTSCVDILPTVLHLFGKEIPNWCEGKILPGFNVNNTTTSRNIYAVEAKRNAVHAPLTKGTIALIQKPYKLIHYLNSNKAQVKYELYNLENDPEEVEDLSISNPSVASDLFHQLEIKLTDINQPYLKK